MFLQYNIHFVVIYVMETSLISVLILSLSFVAYDIALKVMGMSPRLSERWRSIIYVVIRMTTAVTTTSSAYMWFTKYMRRHPVAVPVYLRGSGLSSKYKWFTKYIRRHPVAVVMVFGRSAVTRWFCIVNNRSTSHFVKRRQPATSGHCYYFSFYR